MKKLPIIFLIISFALIIPRMSFAALPYDEFFAVGEKGSEIQKSKFTKAQKPWFYVKFDDGIRYLYSDNSFLVYDPVDDGVSASYKYSKDTILSKNKFWFTFSDKEWLQIKQLGAWKAYAKSVQYSIDRCFSKTIFNGRASFSVSPEPIGTALFLLGAGTLGIIRHRRNKNKA